MGTMNIVVDVSSILVETLTITIVAEGGSFMATKVDERATEKKTSPKSKPKAAPPKAPAKPATPKAAASKVVVKPKAGAAKQTSEARKSGQRVEVLTKSVLEQLKVLQGAKARKDLTKSIPERMKAASPEKSASKPKVAASSTRKVVVKELRADSDFNDIDGLVKASRLGATCHLILGIDANQVDESPGQGVAGIIDRLSKLQGKIGEADPHAFAATVFVLDRTDSDARLDEMGVNQLIDAGACFREKREEYYKPDMDFAAALREDLRDAGLISSGEDEILGMVQTPPSPPAAETEALLQYYGDPEFVWPEGAVEQLLGCGVADASIHLPR